MNAEPSLLQYASGQCQRSASSHPAIRTGAGSQGAAPKHDTNKPEQVEESVLLQQVASPLCSAAGVCYLLQTQGRLRLDEDPRHILPGR